DFADQEYWKQNWTRPTAEGVLRREPEMTAILRPSSKPGSFSVSYKKNADILHTQVDVKDDKYVVVDAAGTPQTFRTMGDVLIYLKVRPFTSPGGAGPQAGGLSPQNSGVASGPNSRANSRTNLHRNG